ncbi:MAG: hypothetical protein Q8880_00940 [Bacteroidota bacterium]|nr:hypothetical protein [Bacteroidota bacterium]
MNYPTANNGVSLDNSLLIAANNGVYFDNSLLIAASGGEFTQRD